MSCSGDGRCIWEFWVVCILGFSTVVVVAAAAAAAIAEFVSARDDDIIDDANLHC